MDNAQSENIGPPDTTWTFTDIDSSYVYSATGRIFPGINIVPVWEDTMLDTTLILQTGKTVPDKLYAILPGSSSTLRYHFAHDSLDTGVGRYKSDYKGTPPIMIETPIGDGTSYYFSVPLYFLNGNENIDDLFRHIFEIDG
ncbi:MAG: hypothetical protein K9N05_07585 [Candidatus Marinimicrobia bacterium]|nr:hypothetical protein [Candidatus Neomarinimicrobiota bacterium]